jgi:hypothetical protein
LLRSKSYFLAPVDRRYELAKAEKGTTHLQSSCDRLFRIPGINRFYSDGIVGIKHKRPQVAYFAEINFLANHISDLSRPMLQLEVDSVLLLLILNEVRIVKTEEDKR